ncbi:hypothetical protein BGZ82_006791 [Podila clonocystis]|nr:hypothetical protein BGZ82_006791 [Podila clonocystis]
MASLENVERELAKVNAQVCAMQDYVNQIGRHCYCKTVNGRFFIHAFQPTQSSEVKRLIHALQEQLDKQVSLNKYLSEEVMRMANSNQHPSLCHWYEGLTLRPLGAAIDTYSQHRVLTRVWLVTFYFLFCCWCSVFTPVTSLSQVTSFWLQCAESTNIVPT